MDARIVAARLLKWIRSRSDDALFAYGAKNEVHLLVGVKNSLSVQGPLVEWRENGSSRLTYSRKPDEHIAAFMAQHATDFVGAYLGYDLHYVVHGFNSLPLYSTSRFFVPQIVISVTSEGIEFLRGNLPIPSWITTAELPDGATAQVQVPVESDTKAEYERRVRRVLEWISQGADRRCTIARKVPLRQRILLEDTFAVGDVSSPYSRSYYLCFSDLAFVGSSPELLFEGNAQRFRTHKLSGTLPRSADSIEDGELRARVETDPKLTHEHGLSALGMARTLRKIGQVVPLATSVMDLSNLRHKLTSFETTTEDEPLWRSLLTILPTGVSEWETGLPLISELEAESRGVYYGLVGLMRPDGEAEFSQNLRTIYRYAARDVAWVGAGITEMSDPVDEFRETCVKLANIAIQVDGASF